MKRILPAIVTTIVVIVFVLIGVAGCKSQCGDHPCGGPKPAPVKTKLIVR